MDQIWIWTEFWMSIWIWSWILNFDEFGSINVRLSQSERLFGLICVPHSHTLGIRGSKTL